MGAGSPAVMPQVVGLSLSDAESRLAEEELVADVTYVDSTEEADTVISQDIAEGEEVERGSSVWVSLL